jgi:hypothetical protein
VGIVHVPAIENRAPPSVHAAPTERELQAAASRTEGSRTRAQARGPFPLTPCPQIPVIALPSDPVPSAQEAPADFPLHASTSG